MNKYIAYLGNWEKYREVFIEASSKGEALSLARKQLQPKDDMIVYIYLNGKCIYDYFNGFKV